MANLYIVAYKLPIPIFPTRNIKKGPQKRWKSNLILFVEGCLI